MGAHRSVAFFVVLVLLFIIAPILQSVSGDPFSSAGSQVLGNDSVSPSLPSSPARVASVGFGQSVLNWVRESIQLQQSIGQSFGAQTQSIGPVQNVPLSVNPSSIFGLQNVLDSYFDPTVTVTANGEYEYTTSFGVYTIKPLVGGNYYAIDFAQSTAKKKDVIGTTAFVLLENSSGNWQLFLPRNLQRIAEPEATSKRFRVTWEIAVNPNHIAIASETLTVDFSKTAFPKITVQLGLYSHKVDPSCVDPDPFDISGVSCATTTYWNDVGLKDYRWIWAVAPSKGHDKLGNVDVASLPSLMDQQPYATTDSLTFSSTWFAEWRTYRNQDVKFSQASAPRNVIGKNAVVVEFPINQSDVDPTFGVTSTGSTSYSTTTNTIGSATSHGNAAENYLLGHPIVASKTGTLTTLGIDAYAGGTAHLRLALYSTYSSSKFSGLLCQTASTSAVTGWNDIGCVASVTASTTYYIAWNTDSTSFNNYYIGTSGTQYYVALAYGSFPDPSATLSSNTSTAYMRMTYVQVKGYTKGTRVLHTGATTANGAVSSFSFYTHTGAAGDHFTLGFYSDRTTTDSVIGSHGAISPVTSQYLISVRVQASSSGLLTSVGLNVANAAGHIRVAIYDDAAGPKPNNLLGESASVVAVTDWNDPSITGVSVVAGNYYWLAYQCDDDSITVYYDTNLTAYSYIRTGYAYSTFPTPYGTGTTYTANPDNLRMTYITPYQRLWYSNSTGSASSTWNVVNYSSGTTDNGWAGALTQNAYYWFMWQWDNIDSGPSYAAGGANTGIYLAQTYGTLDSAWSGGTLSTENWSLYVTYFIYVNITWALSGVGADASGTILTIDSTNYVYADFPKVLSLEVGSTHSVAASNPDAGGGTVGERYSWSSWTNGDGLSGPSSTYTVPSSNTTVTANYVTQYLVTYTSSGISTDTGSNTVVTIDSVAKTQATLPFSTWYNSGASSSYAFSSPVSATSTSKRYLWSSTSGLSQTLQSNTFAVTVNGTITGTYTSTLITVGECWKWSSGAQAGSVCSLGNYTLGSPAINNTLGVYFNFTGKTTNITAMPSYQFRFQAWNTTNTGVIPIVVQSGSVKATYILNALNYSYASTNTTLYTQLSNQSVTVDFESSIGSSGITIPQSTAILTAVPTYDIVNKQLTITAQGTASSTIQAQGASKGPLSVKKNGLVSSSWTYDNVLDILYLNGASTWLVTYSGTPGPGGGGATTTISFVTPQSFTNLQTVTSSSQVGPLVTGGFGGLSTQQIIALLLVLAVGYYLFKRESKRRAEE